MLVAYLLETIGATSDRLNAVFAELSSKRTEIRAAMLEHKAIQCPSIPEIDKSLGYVIDGAHIPSSDRAFSYGIAGAVRVGSSQESSVFDGGTITIPHLTSMGAVIAGYMFMLEIMLAAKTSAEFPDRFVLIDGSKISAIIKINQFYSAFEEMPGLLDEIRARPDDDDAGRILRAFEARNWFEPYIKSHNIVGLPKMVTTRNLVGQYGVYCQALQQFDDKTLAALVLEPGEVFSPFGLKHPLATADNPSPEQAPYHLKRNSAPGKHDGYPFAEEFDALSRELVREKGLHRVWYTYYHAKKNKSIYKVEYPGALNEDRELRRNLIGWLEYESPAIDLQEPYSVFVADKFAKESVSVSQSALTEILRRNMNSSWGWHFTGSYRTE